MCTAKAEATSKKRRTFSSVRSRRRKMYWVQGVCEPAGLPALVFDRDKKKVSIDEDLCAGCSACAQVCPYNAIYEKSIEVRRTLML